MGIQNRNEIQLQNNKANQFNVVNEPLKSTITFRRYTIWVDYKLSAECAKV